MFLQTQNQSLHQLILRCPFIFVIPKSNVQAKVEDPWRAPCQLKKPFKVWDLDEVVAGKKIVFFPKLGSLICLEKGKQKKNEIVARPMAELFLRVVGLPVVVSQPDLLADRQSQALQNDAAKGSMADWRSHDLVVSFTFRLKVALHRNLSRRCGH